MGVLFWLESLSKTHAVCRWGSSWPGSEACLHRHCRDTGVCTAGWVCLARPTNTPHTLHCCHWSHRQQPGDKETFKSLGERELLSHRVKLQRQIWFISLHTHHITSNALKESLLSDLYLWFLAVVFVLYPIDLLQQITHSIHLGKKEDVEE